MVHFLKNSEKNNEISHTLLLYFVPMYLTFTYLRIGTAHIISFTNNISYDSISEDSPINIAIKKLSRC